MSQASRFGSLLVGLGCGSILGLYLAQNYDLPDLHTLSEKLFAKTSEYKKDDKKE